MASSYQKIKGVTVEIGGDTTKLGKALEDVDKKSRNLQGELKEIERLLKLDPTNTELLNQKQKVLAETLKTTKERLDILKEAEKQVQEQFEKGDVSEEQIRALAREIQSATSKIDKCEKEAKETASAIYDLGNNADDTADDVKDLNSEAKNSEEAFGKASSAYDIFIGNLASKAVDVGIGKLKDITGEAVNLGMTFSSSMSEIGAISGATDEELERLEKTAREYGATTAFSANDAAQALKYMALAGWSVDESIDGLPGILNLASASSMDLAEASDMVTDYLSAFSLKAKDSARFADILAFAQANSNTTAQQLGGAYLNCAANLNAAGQSVETVTALLSSMADQGLKGNKAGTALSAIMRDLTANMKDGSVAIGDNNIQVMDADGNYRNLLDILKDVDNATSSMGDAEKAAALSSAFTSDSIKGLNLILNNGVTKTKNFEKSLSNVSGTSSKMSKTMNNNLSGDLKSLNSAWEEFELKIYDSVEEPLRDVVQFLTNKFLPSLTKGGKWVKDNLPQITTLVGGLAGAYLTYKGIVIATDIAHKDIKSTLEATTIAQKALNLAQTATPWGLVATAVGAVVAGLTTYALLTDDATTATSSLTDAEQELINKSAEAAQSFREQQSSTDEAVGGIESQMSHLSDLMDELDKYIGKNGEVKDSDKARVDFILNEYKDATGEEIKMVDGVIENYDDLKEKIRDVIDSKTANAMLEARNADYVKALEEEKKAWGALASSRNEYDEASKAASKSKAELDKAQLAMSDAIKKGYASEIEECNALLAEKQKQYDEDLERYRKAQDDRYQATLDYDNYKTTIIKYEEAMGQAKQGNYTAAIEMMRSQSEAFGKYAESATEAENQVLDAYAKNAEDAKIYSHIIKDNFNKGVSGYSKNMISEAEEARKSTLTIFQNAGGDLEKIGEHLSEGIAVGFGRKSYLITQSAQNSINQAIHAAKVTADIRSPSHKMQSLGEYMGEGLQVGIEAKTKSLTDTAREQMQQLLSAYRDSNNSAQLAYENVQAAARQSNNINIPEPVDTLPILNKILTAVERGQTLYLDSDTIVGGTVDKMNSRLGRLRMQAERG
ncbi:MAG: phage tail tape measure protein [Acutalibacteraceae bacterium]